MSKSALFLLLHSGHLSVIVMIVLGVSEQTPPAFSPLQVIIQQELKRAHRGH